MPDLIHSLLDAATRTHNTERPGTKAFFFFFNKFIAVSQESYHKHVDYYPPNIYISPFLALTLTLTNHLQNSVSTFKRMSAFLKLFSLQKSNVNNPSFFLL